MADYKIEKNIPIPRISQRDKYLFGEMDVGDSFSIEKDNVMQVRSSASYYSSRHNKKFAIRKYKDGYRCWRVA